MVHRFVLAEGGAEQATLWGTPRRVSRTQAALANATAAHSFEFDDVHMGGMIRTGALTLGAALAVGEGAGLDGRELLAAIVAGTEVGARVGRAVGIAHFRAGFHPQGTVGVFAAAAAAARALRLDGSTAREVLGLAGTQAAGLIAAQEGSMAKRLHSGLACQAGARSALLAVTGFAGIPDVLEAGFGGFCSSMGGGDVRLEALTSALGERWETDEIGFKPYASCAAAQSSIEVTRQLRNELEAAGAVARGKDPLEHARQHPLRLGLQAVRGDRRADEHPLRGGEHAPAWRRVGRSLLRGSDRRPGHGRPGGRVKVVGDEAMDALGPDHRYAVRVEIAPRTGSCSRGAPPTDPAGRRSRWPPRTWSRSSTGWWRPCSAPAVRRPSGAPSSGSTGPGTSTGCCR